MQIKNNDPEDYARTLEYLKNHGIEFKVFVFHSWVISLGIKSDHFTLAFDKDNGHMSGMYKNDELVTTQQKGAVVLIGKAHRRMDI